MKEFNFNLNIFELRFRIIYSLVCLLLTFLICFEFKIELFYFISKPFLLFKKEFIYINILGPIFIYLKLSFWFSFLVSFPFLYYNFVSFFFKAFYFTIIKLYTIFVGVSLLINLMLYSIIYIIFIDFFLILLFSFERSDITRMFQLHVETTIHQYFYFFNFIIFIYLIILIIPSIFFIILIKIKKQNYNKINNSFRKYAYFILFLLVLLLSPPDIIIQLLIYFIIILYFELYIYLLLFFYQSYCELLPAATVVHLGDGRSVKAVDCKFTE